MFPSVQKYILVVSMVLSGCLQSSAIVNADQPDWVNAEAKHYPNAQYVVANGSADNPETAKQRALGNLSKVFELHIRESATTTQDVQSHKQAGVETVSSTQRIDSRVNVSTSKIIDGARIAEQWQHPEDRTYYALAVLDRQQAGNNIRGQIDELDAESRIELDRVGKEADPLLQVAALQRVLNNQEQRAALQKTLKVIDLSGRGAEPVWNRAQLRAQMDQALAALRMTAEIIGDPIGDLEVVLRGAMAHAGMVAATAPGGYRLQLGVDAEPVFQQQNWHWQRATMKLSLIGADGKVRGSQSWPLKVSASQPSQLSARLRSKVQQTLNEQLSGAVMGFATGQ
jgi:hypothetical protein